MKAQSFLKKGCQGYLAYIVGNDNDAKLGDISIVRDYSDVFMNCLDYPQIGKWISPLN